MKRKMGRNDGAARVSELVSKLNQYRHEYYNLAAPSVSDAVYDRLFDEIVALEKETGIIYSNSPTQTVGYAPVSALRKVRHSISLLSMDKTKEMTVLQEMAAKAQTLLMLKLDGLTVKLCYENGELIEASTRGDGETGELITHNAPAFCNVPLKIPFKGRLVVVGEGFIHEDDFEQMKSEAAESGEREAGNARNLAAGSIRLLNPAVCKERRIYFHAFNVIEGMEGFGKESDSHAGMLNGLVKLGFEVCTFIYVSTSPDLSEIQSKVKMLQHEAAKRRIPIDGIVLRYDSISYSASLGRTGHHYKDGIAYKFEDYTHETVFRSIEWEPSRSGEIAPVAIFDTVEIDGCSVSRASLHNLSFIRDLELYPDCRILVSKRNMIIPHIEENLDRGHYKKDLIPKKCPCCGKPTRIYSRAGDKNRVIETLHCDNPKCNSQILHKFIHFAEKKAMDMSGVSEATIEKFIERGFLRSYHDFYHLDRYKDEIIKMDGFGERSYQKIQESVEKSRHTTFVRYVVAMDIPMIGRTASRALDEHFGGSLRKFAFAATSGYDFTVLPEFGEIMSTNIHKWFEDADNLRLFTTLQEEMIFERRETMKNTNTTNPFSGCTIVATGKLENFTRDGINSKIVSLGAKAGSSVTSKTNYLICGEKPGSKLTKARELGIPVLTEDEFLNMLSA